MNWIFFILEDGILHSHRRRNLKSYIELSGWALQRTCNVSHVRYELGLYILEDGILHSHRRINLKSYMNQLILFRTRVLLTVHIIGAHK
jgi:hypothetical protein